MKNLVKYSNFWKKNSEIDNKLRKGLKIRLLANAMTSLW